MIRRFLNPKDYSELIERAQPPLKMNYVLFAPTQQDLVLKDRLKTLETSDSVAAKINATRKPRVQQSHSPPQSTIKNASSGERVGQSSTAF